MNIFGLLLAKNEADIIEQTILSLKTHGSYKKIFIYDNNSTDETYHIAKRFEDDVIQVRSLPSPFSDELKYELLNSHSKDFSENDWLSIIDADEIYQESLRSKIEAAELAGANLIEGKSVQFYFSKDEDNDLFNPKIAASEQRRHYLLNYGEPRIFKYSSKFKLNAHAIKSKNPYFLKSPEAFLLHHFQYRSAQQTQKRLDIRIKNNTHSKNWGHINSANWQDYVVNSSYLHYWDGKLKTGLPIDANLYKIENNPAYTLASLLWMKRGGYLTPSQLEFFEASRIKRIFKKIF